MLLLREYDFICNHYFNFSKLFECRTKRFRAAVTRHVYYQLLHYAKLDHIVTDELFLDRAGFFRPSGNVVGLWCTDAVLMHPTTHRLFDLARRLTQLADNEKFKVSARSKTVDVIFDGSCSVARLKACLHEYFGVFPRRQVLTHLGKRVKSGSLASNRIGPGSLVYLHGCV